MVKFRKYTTRVSDRSIDMLVREATRVVGTIDSEYYCLFDKKHRHHDLINSETRSALSQGLIDAASNFALGLSAHVERGCAIRKKRD